MIGRIRLCVSTAVIGCALALVAVASDVSGKWRAEFTTPDGTQRVNTFTFKVDGDRVTGTVAGVQDETPIKDGKVSGDTAIEIGIRITAVEWGTRHCVSSLVLAALAASLAASS